MTPDRKLIEEHFAGRIGRFLELGAHDGRTDSLTCGLVDAGWHGVQVEANPATFLRLCANHGGNDRLELVHAAAGLTRGLAQFWRQDGAGAQESTLSGPHKLQSQDRGHTYATRPHWVQVATPWDILGAFGGPAGWDFLLIDVEGISGETLAAFPLADMTDLSLVCCEADTDPQLIVRIMSPWFAGRPVGVCNVIGRRL